MPGNLLRLGHVHQRSRSTCRPRKSPLRSNTPPASPRRNSRPCRGGWWRGRGRGENHFQTIPFHQDREKSSGLTWRRSLADAFHILAPSKVRCAIPWSPGNDDGRLRFLRATGPNASRRAVPLRAALRRVAPAASQVPEKRFQPCVSPTFHSTRHHSSSSLGRHPPLDARQEHPADASQGFRDGIL